MCCFGVQYLQDITIMLNAKDVPLVEFMYLAFTHVPGELLQVTQVFVVAYV